MSDSINLVYGIHPVLQAVRSGRAKRVMLSEFGSHDRYQRVLSDSKAEIVVLNKREFRDKFEHLPHQGIAAECAPLKIYGHEILREEEFAKTVPNSPPADIKPGSLRHDSVPDSVDASVPGSVDASADASVDAALAEKAPNYPLYVMLDSVTDPQNFGACLRCAVAFGSRGVIFARDNSAPINSVCCKASAGMIEWVRLIRVPNLARAMTELQQKNYWAIAADSTEGQAAESLDLVGPLLLILGSEDKGVRSGLIKRADFQLRIPLCPPAESLNVATASAVCMSAIRSRQRLSKMPD